MHAWVICVLCVCVEYGLKYHSLDAVICPRVADFPHSLKNSDGQLLSLFTLSCVPLCVCLCVCMCACVCVHSPVGVHTCGSHRRVLLCSVPIALHLIPLRQGL